MQIPVLQNDTTICVAAWEQLEHWTDCKPEATVACCSFNKTDETDADVHPESTSKGLLRAGFTSKH